MVFPLIMGVATAAQQGMSAIAGYNDQQQQVDQYNREGRAAKAQEWNLYNRAVKQSQNDWNDALKIRAADTKRYHAQREENNKAANRGMFRNNRRLVEIQDSFKSKALDSYIKELQVRSKAQASGGTGRRAGMAQTELSELGRQRSLAGDALVRYQVDTEERNQEIQDQRKMADYNAWLPVSVPMTRPVGPARPSPFISRRGPSQMSMYSGLLGAGLSGFNTADSLTSGGLFGQRA